MKATGIVRRIDDLGRVVIPKEIRRTLRIREGDPLEIYTDRDGEIILKKYSPIGELGEFAKEYAESLYQNSGFTACITDKDQVIAISGAPKKEYLDKRLSDDMENIIEEKRTVIIDSESGEQPVSICAGEEGIDKYTSQVIVPILSEGDIVGTVILFSSEPGARMGEVEEKLAKTAAGFLGKQLEQ